MNQWRQENLKSTAVLRQTSSTCLISCSQSSLFSFDDLKSVIPKSKGARIACWLEHWTCDRKVANSNPGRSGRRIFFLFSQLCVLTFTWCPFHPRVNTVASKRPRSFCQKRRWQVTPKHACALTQWSRSGLTMLLPRHSVETYQETSSHATRQGTLSHSKSGISVRELISTLKKKKKAQAGNELSNILQKSLRARKRLPLLPYLKVVLWHLVQF